MSDLLGDALAELRRAVQPDDEPALTTDELTDILDACLRATTWAVSSVYSFGDVVMPGVRDGHRYVCTQGGTSGASQPTFATAPDATTTDGTVIWREAGPDYANPYDMRRAKREAWLLKAAKASEFAGADEARIYDTCSKEAARYVTVGIS